MNSTFPNCGRLVLGFIDADRCDQILSFQDVSRSTRFAYLEPALPKILFGDSVGKLALCVNVLVQTVDVAAFRRVSVLRCETGDALHILQGEPSNVTGRRMETSKRKRLEAEKH